MRKVLISFTLRKPELRGDYEFFYSILYACSARFVRRDESEILIVTPYGDVLLRQLLGFAIDQNDTLNIYGIESETGINQTGEWQLGGLGARNSVRDARQLVADIRRRIGV